MIDWTSLIGLMGKGQPAGAMPMVQQKNGMADFSEYLKGGTPTGAPEKKTPWLNREGMGGLTKGELLLAGMGMLSGRNLQEGFGNSAQIAYGGMERKRKEQEKREKSEALTKAMGMMQSGDKAGAQALLAEINPNAVGAGLAEQAFAGPAQPLEINGQLVDPTTYEQIADFRDAPKPEQRRIVKGADGYDYYEDTKERVLPNDRKAAPARPAPWKGLNAGDGTVVMYNEQTGAFQAVTADGGGAVPAGPQTFNADTGTSPFDSLGTYQGGRLIQARYDGEGFGGRHGGGQGGPDMGQQGDFTEMSPGGRKPTDFDKTQDRELAKDIAEWKTSGQANALTNLTRLQSVISTLRDPNKNTTGPVIGGMYGRKVFAQGSVDAQQTAEAAVQGSLKAILGGQFAQAEAEALFNRTYDPQLSEEVNAQRLELLYNDLVNRARLNEGLARYADQYGTTQGFNGYLPGLADFGQEQAEATSGPAALGSAEPARAPFGGMVKRDDYEKTATNPETGERIGLRNGQWEAIQ